MWLSSSITLKLSSKHLARDILLQDMKNGTTLRRRGDASMASHARGPRLDMLFDHCQTQSTGSIGDPYPYQVSLASELGSYYRLCGMGVIRWFPSFGLLSHFSRKKRNVVTLPPKGPEVCRYELRYLQTRADGHLPCEY